MELVTIHYPHPGVADSEVPESAVDQWRQHGWLTGVEYEAWLAQQETADAKDPAESKPAASAKPPEGAADQSTDQPQAKRRSTSSKGE